MNYTNYTLLVDFGLVVLIWLVQLIIYPTFASIDEARFSAYHAWYSQIIGFFVIPLMFGQVGLHAWGIYTAPSPAKYMAAGLIGLIWCSTFLLSVPNHNILSAGSKDPAVIHSLITTNWIRTIGWSLVFVLSLIDISKNSN